MMVARTRSSDLLIISLSDPGFGPRNYLISGLATARPTYDPSMRSQDPSNVLAFGTLANH